MPPRQRYREKELRKMEPLDELPEALILGRVPGLTRKPPLLRKGYHIPRATLCRIIDEAGFRPIPEGKSPRYVAACIERILQVRLGWPIECYHVYGLPGPAIEALIAGVAQSYNPHLEIPEVQERVRKELRVEGPARWYLDSEVPQWYWKEVYGMR